MQNRECNGGNEVNEVNIDTSNNFKHKNDKAKKKN